MKSHPQKTADSLLQTRLQTSLQTPLRTLLQVLEGITEIWSEWRRQKLPLYLFLAFCFNLLIAPVVYAASDSTFSRTQAWAIGLLVLATLALSVYLFFVMFVPERF